MVKQQCFIYFSYKIDDLKEERKLRVNLNISLCFESAESCLYEISLFKDTLVPKPLCDWEANSYLTQSKIDIYEDVSMHDLIYSYPE